MMCKNKNSELIFCSLPFYSGVLDSPLDKRLPDSLPFTLIYDAARRLIVQKWSAHTENILNQAYKYGSLLSTNLGQGTFGVSRAEDALSHLSMAINGKVQGESFLEVGCGDGYLLHKLKAIGAGRLLGCEPGPAALEGSTKHAVRIVNAFYEKGVINETFDCVFSYGVLEHIVDPSRFIQNMTGALREGGTVFVAVPNCETKLELGDVSILNHEHWNYFTRSSLINLLRKSMLSNINACIGANDAVIYAWGSKSSTADSGPLLDDGGNFTFDRYRHKVHNIGSILYQRAKLVENRGQTLGFYGGGLNMTSFLPTGLRPRFFDGDVAKQGKYFPGFVNPIEPPDNLIQNRVDEVWVAAIDYTNVITKYLKNQLKIPSNITIVSIKEILEQA